MSRKVGNPRHSKGGANLQRTRLEQALAGGDIGLAAQIATSILAAGQSDPLILNLVAWQKEEAGDFAGAHALLQRALLLSPGDVLILGSIGAVMRKQGFQEEALAVLDRVVAAEPRHAAAWLERGYVLDALRLEHEAVSSYERALAIDANLAPAWGKLADSAARRGDAETSQTHAKRALALDPHEPAATCALAILAIERKDGVSAAALLEPLLNTQLSEDRTRALTLMGDALDRQNRTEEAFASYENAQRSFRNANRAMLAPTEDRPSHRSFIERITEQVESIGALPALIARPPIPEAAAMHVFLLGYPRSGTTLIENVLAGAPNVVALEERDTFVDVDAALLSNDGTMPDLDALDPVLVDRLRAAYWDRVTQLGGAVDGKVLVDMNPFNGIKLPIIARLFPDARIVIMRRDPRDVILSCFRINFTPGAAAWAFSDLIETARHYDALLTLIDRCMENLPLAYHDVRYSQLVTEFEPTVRALAAFVGLEWTDSFLNFDRTAKARGVRTASETQVRKGLYNGGGQWRRYASALKPVQGILAPWVARFGSDT
ncbi:tetratricopeptide repeat-containing sulfotransferase family protein [Sphingobium boeckii]|uniref:Tetratricopeptide (TPR) repeat protein n=1 Tax=Sphingobium boeckii TaxID=1082345 RepID=A0A7W9AFD7_9SPHN|nr:tetratricopeptide repeat-containing sulfotransferase family protein [Sphingobium boeckii]MBB5684655.1 tetratricopeptide (TPR) repeat protein [Sphingobium boeckii]